MVIYSFVVEMNWFVKGVGLIRIFILGFVSILDIMVLHGGFAYL